MPHVPKEAEKGFLLLKDKKPSVYIPKISLSSSKYWYCVGVPTLILKDGTVYKK